MASTDGIKLVEYRNVLGKLLWACIINRPLLAILNAVFRWNHSQDTSPALKYITNSVRKELVIVCQLLPLNQISLNVPSWPVVVAFDACMTDGAAVSTRLPENIIHYIWKFSVASQDPSSLEYVTLPPSLQLHITDAKWSICFKHKRTRKEHINGLEASAACIAIKWLIQHSAANCKVLLITDSPMALGSLRKGRSPSIPLLLRCRRVAAILLAKNIRMSIVHAPSSVNPADGPSRC